jgi:hypothetical protein
MTSSNRRLVDSTIAFALENVAARAAGVSPSLGVTVSELQRLARRRTEAQRRIRRRVRRSFLIGAIVGAFATAATHGFGGASR